MPEWHSDMHRMISRRTLVQTSILIPAAIATMGCGKPEPVILGATAGANGPDKLIKAAKAQIGETTIYDPAYVTLSYPGGDVPRERGVCTDVVIRAYRDAFAVDLQELVNNDMRKNFSAYPTRWGLKKPDRNIDHRRVPNLQVFFSRHDKVLPITEHPDDYLAGDLVTMQLSGNLPHIAIVSDERSPADNRPSIIHNIGRGTQIEDLLFAFKIDGHFRVLNTCI
jgi:uncharacterized protein